MSDSRRIQHLVALFSRYCGNDDALLQDWTHRFEQGEVPYDGEWVTSRQVRWMVRSSRRRYRRRLFELGAVFAVLLVFDLLLAFFVISLYH